MLPGNQSSSQIPSPIVENVTINFRRGESRAVLLNIHGQVIHQQAQSSSNTNNNNDGSARDDNGGPGGAGSLNRCIHSQLSKGASGRVAGFSGSPDTAQQMPVSGISDERSEGKANEQVVTEATWIPTPTLDEITEFVSK